MLKETKQKKENQIKEKRPSEPIRQGEASNEMLSLVEGAQYSGYSSDYLRLRIRQNKLKAKKLGRDWVTTKKWLDDYLKEHSKKNTLSTLNQVTFKKAKVVSKRVFKAGSQGLFFICGLFLVCWLVSLLFIGRGQNEQGAFLREIKLSQAKAANFSDFLSYPRENNVALSVKKNEGGEITEDDLRSALALVGVDLTLLDNGLIKITQVEIDRAEIKKIKITEFEMLDKASGNVWCIWLDKGEFAKKEGTCPKEDSTNLPQRQPQPEPATELNLKTPALISSREKLALEERFKALAPFSDVLEKPPKT